MTAMTMPKCKTDCTRLVRLSSGAMLHGMVKIVLACCVLATVATAQGEDFVTFETRQLDGKFRSEGVSVGDFNADGKMDIAAGSAWYAAPDWTMHPIADAVEEFDPHAYSNSFVNVSSDVDGDGARDVIVVGFPGKETWWWKNPGKGEGRWRRNLCTEVSNNESPTFCDVNGDGRRELLLGTREAADGADKPREGMALLNPTTDPFLPWKVRIIAGPADPAAEVFGHGLGIGDINRDGRTDILVTSGWWEQPAGDNGHMAWSFHRAPFGEACAQMHVFDFDGDGDNDVVSSSAHQVGIWWHEQTADGWQTHTISTLFSQTHALELADINGDGLPDLVTGKRWWAHGPKGDVDPSAPAVVYWFELTRRDGKPVWLPHLIHDNSGVGTQFEVADINADGLLDIAVSNKKGVFYHRQVRNTVAATRK